MWNKAKKEYQTGGIQSLFKEGLLFFWRRIPYRCKAHEKVISYYNFNNDINPVCLYWISPNIVEACTGGLSPEHRMYHLDNLQAFSASDTPLGQIKGGDWDINTCSFEELEIYQGIKTRYGDGLDWSETDFFQHHVDRIAEYGESYGCTSEEELSESLSKVDEAYEAIKKNGYKPQREINGHPKDEILVNVGRDGRILFNGHGRHRLSIAKVLGLDCVPVRVLVWHREWIESNYQDECYFPEEKLLYKDEI